MKERVLTQKNRIHWIDNLRTIIIFFLVVLYHVGSVYESAGLWGWFWIVDDPDTMSWVGIVGIVFDLFVMPTMFYIAGMMCCKRNIFAELPQRKTLYIIACSAAWLPMTGHIFIRLWPFIVSGFTITPLYKLLWFLSFHLSSLLLVYILVESFQFYITETGKLWEVLNRNSYGVYIIHVIVIGLFGTLLLNMDLPVLVKWELLIISTYFGINLLVMAYRKTRHALSSSTYKASLKIKEAN